MSIIPEDYAPCPDNEEIICTECGRYASPGATCSFCGAGRAMRADIRIMRYGAVILATIGLALLYAMVLTREIPLVEIGKFNASMNFAVVRVAGRVNGEPRLSWRAGRLHGIRLRLDDGTGSLSVWVDEKASRVLEAINQLPQAEDWMEVTGRLSISAEYRSLRLRSPERVRISRETLPISDLSAVVTSENDSIIRVVATILDIVEPSDNKRPWVIKLGDGSARCDLVIWHEQWRHLVEREKWQAGMRVLARGRVSRYRNRPQLTLLCVTHLVSVEHRTETIPGYEPREEVR